MQILDSHMLLGRNLSLQHDVPTNRRGLRVYGSFHSAECVLEMCANKPNMACVPIIINSDQAGLWVHGAIWPIYASFPSLPPELVNTTCLMPHIGMIPILQYDKGLYEGLYGTHGRFMFAARKRHLMQSCLSIVARAVNDHAEGRMMRVQGKYQMVNARVTTVSCDHQENTNINGCQPLMCPRCFDYVGSKKLPDDLFDWDYVRDEYEDEDEDLENQEDEDIGKPQSHIHVEQNDNIEPSSVKRPFWWTPKTTAERRAGGPRPRSSELTSNQVAKFKVDVYEKSLPAGADCRSGVADNLAKVDHWNFVRWPRVKVAVAKIGIYPFYNPLWDVPNFEVCHSTPVDEMHAWRLGVLLRLVEYALLHLLTSLKDLKDGPEVKIRLVQRIRSVGQSRSNKHEFVAQQMTGWYDEAIVKAKLLREDNYQAPRKNAGKPHKIGSLSAAETFQFVEDSPFILDNLLQGLSLKDDADDQLKQDIVLVVRMLALYRSVTAPFFTAAELTRIHEEVINTIAAFGSQLGTKHINVPKTHLMMHLVSDMAKFGRTINYTTEAMERRHQDVKTLADVTNRKADFHRQILMASTRRDLLAWTNAGTGDDEAKAALREGEGYLSDGDTNLMDVPHLAGPTQMCSITGCRASGNFPLWDFLSQHNQKASPSVYTLVAPARMPHKFYTLFRFRFQDIHKDFLLEWCPVLKNLHILTCEFLFHVVWNGTSGGVSTENRGWEFPRGDVEVQNWLQNFTSDEFFKCGEHGTGGAGVQVFNCLKLTVPSISLTSLRMRASPQLNKFFHGQAMAGATVMWVPYEVFMNVPCPVAKEAMDLLGNTAHMKLVRFATVECFFRFQSKSATFPYTYKMHDMALIRELHIWNCTETACSFDTIQLASCAEPQGVNMLQVIEVDRILGNVVLVRNQAHPTIPSWLDMTAVDWVPPGIKQDSDKGPVKDNSVFGKGKANAKKLPAKKKSKSSAGKKNAGSQQVPDQDEDVPMQGNLHPEGDGSKLWHVHPEWRSRRTRFDAGIHSVVS